MRRKRYAAPPYEFYRFLATKKISNIRGLIMASSAEEHGYFGSPKLLEVLLDDAGQAFRDLWANTESQYLRRNSVRAAFGCIEGICAVLSNEVLLKYLRGAIRLSLKEIKVIENKEAELVQRIKKSFSAYNKLHNSNFILDTESSGFSCLRIAKRIRNNLTHPSRYSHVLISDSDVATIAKAYLWIKDECKRLMESVIETNLQKLSVEDRTVVRNMLDKTSSAVGWAEKPND
ncbi:MAG: hypothetical protein ACOY3E_18130 [Pseudomonadota bacterium]